MGGGGGRRKRIGGQLRGMARIHTTTDTFLSRIPNFPHATRVGVELGDGNKCQGGRAKIPTYFRECERVGWEWGYK